MRRRFAALAIWFLTVFALAACGPSSKEDMLARTKDAKTRAQLETALGKPDDVRKLGPVEKWTYRARNGQVVFILVGETVTIEAAGPSERKN
jgi:uncharacterized lipoprotein